MPDTSVNEAAQALVQEAHDLRDAARAAARRVRDAGTAEVEKLIADVDELIAQLADIADPAIARMRTRVADTVRTTRRAVAESAAQAHRQAREVLSAGDSYVRKQPWGAVGVAALAGAIIGVLISRR